MTAEYITLDSAYLEEMQTREGQFPVPLKVLVYCYLRWCEQSGKYGFMVADNDYLAERFGCNTKAIEKALFTLKEEGLIEHVWCDKKVYRNKTKVWLSTVRLAGAPNALERIRVLKRGQKNAEILSEPAFSLREKELETTPNGVETTPNGVETTPSGVETTPSGVAQFPVPPLSENIIDNNRRERESDCAYASPTAPQSAQQDSPAARPAAYLKHTDFGSMDSNGETGAPQVLPLEKPNRETPREEAPLMFSPPVSVKPNRDANTKRRRNFAIAKEVRTALNIPIDSIPPEYAQAIGRWADVGLGAKEIIEAHQMLEVVDPDYKKKLNPLGMLSTSNRDWYIMRKNEQNKKPKGVW